MTLFMYVSMAVIFVAYVAALIRFRRYEAQERAWMRIATGVMFLAFGMLYLLLGVDDIHFKVVLVVVSSVVIVYTMFSVRPLLTNEGDPRYGSDRHLDPELQRH